MVRGQLFALSGIDGSGKTTQAARLVESLRNHDPAAEQVKARLTALQGVFALSEDSYGDPHDYHPHIPATLREFTIACDLLAWSRDTLRPLLQRGSAVVWDRSPLCYETYARCYGADMTWPAKLLARVEQPDVIFLLDVTAKRSVERLAQRAHQPHQTDEDEELLAQARQMYLHLAASRANVVVIDADRPEDDVTSDLIRHIEERFGNAS